MEATNGNKASTDVVEADTPGLKQDPLELKSALKTPETTPLKPEKKSVSFNQVLDEDYSGPSGQEHPKKGELQKAREKARIQEGLELTGEAKEDR
jgi:hypothetical protein